jgi:hypothetical protein
MLNEVHDNNIIEHMFNVVEYKHNYVTLYHYKIIVTTTKIYMD